jgi:hypothetical protein
MAQQIFKNDVLKRAAFPFLLLFALAMMLTPYIVSVVANIGRRPWPSRRLATETRPRAMLSAPPRIAA